MKRILISNVLDRVPTSTSKWVWESRSAMRPLWLPPALLGTSEPHGAVVAGDVVAQLLLSTGVEADRAGIHSAPRVVAVGHCDRRCAHYQNHRHDHRDLCDEDHHKHYEVPPVGVVLHCVEPGPRPHVLLVGKTQY